VTYSYSKIFLFFVISIVIFISIIGLYYDYFLSYLDDSIYNNVPHNVPYEYLHHDVSTGSTCVWKSTDPVIFNYRINKVSSSTSYDEDYDVDDYLTQLYSIVKERNLLSDHNTVIYNIDKGEVTYVTSSITWIIFCRNNWNHCLHHNCHHHLEHTTDDFVSHMSGNTRLLMHLSSKLPGSFSKELYFSHIIDHNWHKTLRSGDTVLINPGIFNQLQVWYVIMHVDDNIHYISAVYGISVFDALQQYMISKYMYTVLYMYSTSTIWCVLGRKNFLAGKKLFTRGDENVNPRWCQNVNLYTVCILLLLFDVYYINSEPLHLLYFLAGGFHITFCIISSK